MVKIYHLYGVVFIQNLIRIVMKLISLDFGITLKGNNVYSVDSISNVII